MDNLDVFQTPGANISISGGTFIGIAGDVHTHYTNFAPSIPGDRASEAIYDSAELSGASTCHPNTRVRIQKMILDWIEGGDPRYSVFWLHGRVGEGKTSIMRSVAHTLIPYGNGDVPTFFFGRGKGKREQSQYLFLTLAQQLMPRISGLWEHLNEIMIEKPTLPSSSMDSQVRSLFIDAFQRLEQSTALAPQVILIDGLDECNSETDQQTILRLIGEMITVHALPLLFIIASRPEPHIREMFEGDVLYPITLQATISEDPSSLQDIETFLRQKFGEIYKRKSRLIDRIQGSRWPGDDVIEVLVHRSSGQFIYASTIIKFIDDKFSRPDDQLNVILSPQLLDRKAFSVLDSLYLQILSAYPDDKIADLKRLLGFIITLSRSSGSLLEDLLQVRHGEVELTLGGLHSVLSGITPTRRASDGRTATLEKFDDLRSWSDFTRTVRRMNVIPRLFTSFDPDLDVTHASFIDFLLDPSRSGPYHIDLGDYDFPIATATFTMMSRSILSSLHGIYQLPFSVETVMAMESILFYHLARLPSPPQRVLNEIYEVEEAFHQLNLLPGSPIPVESFVGIDLLITVTHLLDLVKDYNLMRAFGRLQ
ncbi:hypothetical protein CPB84DRAFT_1747191 [Gymnopilus junonius]|uniref:Nephrocystin 3-like N-terminal domain-containing protein n=1 Tax=Gymnopilus junonius TaxID=109634 RepID=A0A9P5TNM3_GYMJU|nr:hypothetical protein CPB84DRAFT_1747191 [Gymnopilus junonius]